MNADIEGKNALEMVFAWFGGYTKSPDAEKKIEEASQYVADLEARAEKAETDRDRLRDALTRLLLCPAIADGEHSDPAWGCLETVEAESFARKTLKDTRP